MYVRPWPPSSEPEDTPRLVSIRHFCRRKRVVLAENRGGAEAPRVLSVATSRRAVLAGGRSRLRPYGHCRLPVGFAAAGEVVLDGLAGFVVEALAQGGELAHPVEAEAAEVVAQFAPAAERPGA